MKFYIVYLKFHCFLCSWWGWRCCWPTTGTFNCLWWRSCDHYKTTNPSPSLLWYKQWPNGFPEFIPISYMYNEQRTGETFKQRLHSKVNSTSKSAPLKIQNLQSSDSAVYYCAMTPTVTSLTLKQPYPILLSYNSIHNIDKNSLITFSFVHYIELNMWRKYDATYDTSLLVQEWELYLYLVMWPDGWLWRWQWWIIVDSEL